MLEASSAIILVVDKLANQKVSDISRPVKSNCIQYILIQIIFYLTLGLNNGKLYFKT